MSDADDRTIPATPRRRELARRQGAMPTASQPAWAAAATTTVLLLPAWWRAIFPAATEMMRWGLVTAVADGASDHPRWSPPSSMALLVPTVAVVAAAGVVGLSVRLLLDGGGWRLSRAAPDLHRISLPAGLSRIFSTTTAAAIVVNALALAIMILLGGIAAGALAAAVGASETVAHPARLSAAAQRLFAVVAATAVVLAACQWALARLRFERRIRMTPQEFLDETRSMQAAPHVRLMHGRRAKVGVRTGVAAGDSAS